MITYFETKLSTDNMSSVVIEKVETSPTKRIPAAERRELILQAATEVFAERGYAGATTDQIARAANISQPYVVRMFGTKEALFLEAAERALDKVIVAFRAVISGYNAGDFDKQLEAMAVEEPNSTVLNSRGEGLGRLIGMAYVDLIKDRGILMMLMHSFVAGHEPVIGPFAREGFLKMFTLLQDEAGLSEVDARDFLAHGMLMNTLISLRMPEVYGSDPAAAELLECTLGGKLPLVLEASQEQDRVS